MDRFDRVRPVASQPVRSLLRQQAYGLAAAAASSSSRGLDQVAPKLRLLVAFADVLTERIDPFSSAGGIRLDDEPYEPGWA